MTHTIQMTTPARIASPTPACKISSLPTSDAPPHQPIDAFEPLSQTTTRQPNHEETVIFSELLETTPWGQQSMGPSARAIKHLASAGTPEARTNISNAKLQTQEATGNSFGDFIALIQKHTKIVATVLDPSIDKSKLTRSTKGYLNAAYSSMLETVQFDAYRGWDCRAVQYQKALLNVEKCYAQKFGKNRHTFNLIMRAYDNLKKRFIKYSESITEEQYQAHKMSVRAMVDDIQSTFKTKLTLTQIKHNAAMCASQVR